MKTAEDVQGVAATMAVYSFRSRKERNVALRSFPSLFAIFVYNKLHLFHEILLIYVEMSKTEIRRQFATS